jgi:hypothetical protein
MMLRRGCDQWRSLLACIVRLVLVHGWLERDVFLGAVSRGVIAVSDLGAVGIGHLGEAMQGIVAVAKGTRAQAKRGEQKIRQRESAKSGLPMSSSMLASQLS